MGRFIASVPDEEHFNDDTSNSANGGHKTITIQPGNSGAGKLRLSLLRVRCYPLKKLVRLSSTEIISMHQAAHLLLYAVKSLCMTLLARLRVISIIRTLAGSLRAYL